MSQSPAFSSFRQLLDTYDTYSLLETKKKGQKQEKVKNIIDGQNLIMFFKRGNGIFGAPEESRITFARLKNPSADGEFDDEANFSAFDLMKAMQGASTENIFSTNDMEEIEVIPRDEVEHLLMQCPDEGNTVNLSSNQDDGSGINVIKLKDKE